MSDEVTAMSTDPDQSHSGQAAAAARRPLPEVLADTFGFGQRCGEMATLVCPDCECDDCRAHYEAAERDLSRDDGRSRRWVSRYFEIAHISPAPSQGPGRA